MISLIGSGIPTHHPHTLQPLSAKLNPPAIPQLSGFTAYSKLAKLPAADEKITSTRLESEFRPDSGICRSHPDLL
jgi:hypothetical protein